MAYRLPNGSTFDFASEYSEAIDVVSISNATEAVVTTATEHGFADGDIVALDSAWLRLTGRSFRIKDASASTLTLEGLDTTNTTVYPSGTAAGTGTIRAVENWIQIPQITEVTFTGGEQQFYTFGFLEDTDDRQIPTSKSASSMALTVADDPEQPFVPVVEAADLDGETRVQRLNLVNGDIILYNSIVSFTSTPTLTRNELMTRTITLSLQGRITRYTSAD